MPTGCARGQSRLVQSEPLLRRASEFPPSHASTIGQQMNRKLIALIGILVCAIGLMLTAAPFLWANGGEPPTGWCLAGSKQEYVTTNRQMLFRTRFTAYERTGYLGQRHY